MLKVLLKSILTLSAVMALAGPALAITPAPSPTPVGNGVPVGDVATACGALVKHDFSAVPDAPSLVATAKVVPATADMVAHCLVDGRIAPTIGYRMWLPMATWNGKFVQSGCGGRCGWILNESCEIAMMRGYACIAADLGHTGTMYDNLWAIDNVSGEIDFGFRATHVTNITGRAVVAQFYGRAPKYTYYIGASTGGRQGLVEAQRFPQDFDGVIAGEPAMGTPGSPQPEVGPKLFEAVAALALNGTPIITPAQIMMLHEKAIASCDMDDNLKDGFISDPNRCAFTPQQLLCKGAASADCFSQPQIDAIKKVYAAGAMPGSEKGWIGAYVQKDGSMGRYGSKWANPYHYPYAWVYNDATNPDLRAFKSRGGKLILYQGWADEAVFPNNPVNYYETVQRLMGGRAQTQDFFRLFMIPGESHIPGNGGAETVDYLSYLEAWVERGQAPDVLEAAKMIKLAKFAGPVTYPEFLGRDNIDFSRPVYPYPVQARYKGNGDPKSADSFAPYLPKGVTL